MTVKEILNYSIKILNENDIEDYRIKSKILISFVTGIQKESLIAHDNEKITDKQEKIIKKHIKDLVNGKPIQYITKNQEFMKLNFFVNESVLIPRPDTEILVEEVLDIAKKQEKKVKIFDLCTGSGAIAISLAKNLPNIQVVASDISKEALKIAKVNAQKNEVNINIVQADLFDGINEKFDIIVSNPPYIKTEDIKMLAKDVQNEPFIALDGGKTGLEIYKKIIKNANEFLEPNGWLCLEIGYDQKEEIIKLINETNNYNNIYSKKDLAGNDRIVVCRRN